MIGVDAEPFEVSYMRSGRQRLRCVIGVLCPRPVPLLLGVAKPIYVEMGDAKANWGEGPSPGMQCLLETGIAT